MAISGRYTAVLDACVLFSRLQRDVLLSLAHADLYTARWTQDIEREWASSLVEKYPDAADKIPRLVEHMREAIPDCLIVDYAPLITSIQYPMREIDTYWQRPSEAMQTPLSASTQRTFLHRCWPRLILKSKPQTSLF